MEELNILFIVPNLKFSHDHYIRKNMSKDILKSRFVEYIPNKEHSLC